MNEEKQNMYRCSCYIVWTITTVFYIHNFVSNSSVIYVETPRSLILLFIYHHCICLFTFIPLDNAKEYVRDVV